LPERRPLPDTRPSLTHKVRIETEQGSLAVYFTVSLYEDGSPAEIFINAGKVGSTVRGLLNDLSRLLSFALQYGVPAHNLFERMAGSNYAPQGATSNEALPTCKSITDYLFRWLLSLEKGGDDGEGQ
jgi:ribonucleoside-diphosphate reductase alpha chain